MAKAKDRRDKVISVTMPVVTSILLDMVAEAKGYTRSEYIRYLILNDAPNVAAEIMAAAIDEGVKASSQRSRKTATPSEQLAITAAKELADLQEEYKPLVNNDGFDVFEYNEDGIPVLRISNDAAVTFEQFETLDVKMRHETIRTAMAYRASLHAAK